MSEEERRAHVYLDLNELKERVARIEEREHHAKGDIKDLAREIKGMAQVQQAMALKLNSIEAQRNSVIAAAAFVGAVVTFIGKGLFDLMVRGAK